MGDISLQDELETEFSGFGTPHYYLLDSDFTFNSVGMSVTEGI